MRNLLVAVTTGALLGTLLGATAVYVVFERQPIAAQRASIQRDIVSASKMSAAESRQHREDRFAEITTIADTLALPTDFLQTEALYVLAGRSGSSAIQDLIHQANRMTDGSNRTAALRVLFMRLAELDPQSALALARSAAFATDRYLEGHVWYSWAKHDLDAALDAADAETDVAQRDAAAQALFGAYDFMGNATVERIEARLGIALSRTSRAQYLWNMVTSSPEEAIGFLNSLDPGTEKDEYVAWIGSYIARRYPQDAARYTGLLNDNMAKRQYKAAIVGGAVQTDPRSIVDQLITKRRSQYESVQLHSALQSLARSDLDAAINYFSELRSTEERQNAGSAIVMELMKSDINRAIAWARENDSRQFPYLLTQVLSDVAAIDPQLAVNEAAATDNRNTRTQLMSSVLSRIAADDPESAVTYLDHVSSRQERNNLASNIVSQWVQTDPDIAIDWVLQADDINRDEVLSQAGGQLVYSDLEAALRLLPRVDGQAAVDWRNQIAPRIAVERSIQEAQAFIARYKDEMDYGDMQIMFIKSLAYEDVYTARRVADQIAEAPTRDRAYLQLVSVYAADDPAEAASWLDDIVNPDQRRRAMVELAQAWHDADPGSAERWVNDLPRGEVRDDAIVSMAGSWSEPSQAQRRLIESIGDHEKRAMATMSQISVVAQSDWRLAEAMLTVSSLNKAQREQVQQYIDYYKNGYKNGGR